MKLNGCVWVMSIITVVFCVSCTGDGFQSSQGGSSQNLSGDSVNSEEAQERLLGIELYQKNCASCHGDFSQSVKMGRSAEQISAAINNVTNMNHLQFLSKDEVAAIAMALKFDDDLEVADEGPSPEYEGEYLSVSKSYACEPTQLGQSRKTIRRLTRQELLNTITSIFGDQVLLNETVKSRIHLLPTDKNVNHSDGIDNSLNYIEGMYLLSQAVVDYTFSQNQRVNSLLPGCSNNPESNSCESSVLNLARLVYRRPLTQTEKDSLLSGQDYLGGDLQAVKLTIVRMMVAPEFHQHLELNTSGESNGRFRLSDHEVASRLSYALTQYPPDSALSSAADRGELKSLAQIESQAQRLINTPQAEQAFQLFIRGWLRVDPNVDPHPAMAQALGISPTGISQEFSTELDQYIKHVVFAENGGFAKLYTEPVAFPSTSRLANFLNLTRSSQPQRTGPERGGVLLRPAVTKSGQLSSSPISRGVVMRRRVLCSNLPSPDFSIVNDRLEELEDFPHEEFTTIEITNNITASESCMGCHSQINSLGYAMNQFGPFGNFRQVEDVYDDRGDVLASHTLSNEPHVILLPGVNGINVRNHKDLVDSLANTPGAARCFSQQLYRYTRYRKAQKVDGCVMEKSSQSLLQGASVKEAIVNNIVNEEIFWRSAE